jgi:hypothetical protein
MYRKPPVTESVDLVLHEDPNELEPPCKCRCGGGKVWLLPILAAIGILFGIFASRYGFLQAVVLTGIDVVITLVLFVILAIVWTLLRARLRVRRTRVRLSIGGLAFTNGRPTIPLDDLAIASLDEKRLALAADHTRSELRGSAPAIARALEMWSLHQ